MKVCVWKMIFLITKWLNASLLGNSYNYVFVIINNERLQEKLEGIESGIQLSTSGQVTHLINEATNDGYLCMLFHGWQPWI